MARRGVKRGLTRASLLGTLLGGDVGGAAAALTLDTTALLFYDSFNRADSETVGSPDVDVGGFGAWVEEIFPDNADILSNRLSFGSNGSFVHRPNTEAVVGPLYSQTVGQWESASIPLIMGQFGDEAFASRVGYQARPNDSGSVLAIDEQPFATLASAAFTMAVDTDYGWELYTDDGVQEAAIVDPAVPGTVVTVTSADATNDGDARRVSLQRGATSTPVNSIDAVFGSAGANARQIVVTGVPTGYTVEIRQVSDDAVIVSAAESSGTATMRIDMFEGGTAWTASLTVWPALMGTALYMALVDDAAADVATLVGSDLDEGNIWPGAYSYS